MPYSIEEAKRKSQLYNNMIDSDINEYLDKVEDLKKRQQISGSVDANVPPRDEDGTYVSFESNVKGVSVEESFQEVRLENKQRFFDKQVPNEFTFFIPNSQTTTTEQTETTSSVSDEEVEFQMTNRDFLIQVIREYFNENFTPDISTDLLHSRLNRFFKIEGQMAKTTKQVISDLRFKGKNKNAEGWEEFRQDKINVAKFTRKGKKKRIGGSRSHRHNYRSLKRDLNGFYYDDVINKQLYHTRKGQEIWLKLGLPYVKDT